MPYRQTAFTDYEGFVNKFKPKKTTDDCYTPPEIYETVKNWVLEEYGIDETRPILRPFNPGGDYEHEGYPDGCIVIDNPPFSILAKILRFYIAHNIDFFLFAPTLTCLSADIHGKKSVITGVQLNYANGAKVNTSFQTNLGDAFIRSAPRLTEKLTEVNKRLEKRGKKQLPKYDYPSELITAARVAYMSAHGVDFRVTEDECYQVSRLDAQPEGKLVFGHGYLISSDAAARNAAACNAAARNAADEKSRARILTLSDREKQIVAGLK